MILHIDMDAFFAAIEQRDNPELMGKPVIISKDHKRSVVATASYEARKFGIHSAMPVFQAKQQCRHLEIIAGNMRKYKDESKKIMAILSGFSPLVEPVSIDEAYLDIHGCERLFGSPEQIGMAIKDKIFKSLSLTSSVGIAPVKFLSKIASDMNKPDGLTIIEKSQMQNVINTLPIEQVPGVGKKATKQMLLLKIKTLGDIQKFPLPVLIQKFGSMGRRLNELSLGMDASTITTGAKRKSISSETTLPADISDYNTIKQIILDKSQTVGRQLRRKNLLCNNVAIKLKFSDFSQITRQNRLSEYVCSSTDIFNEALLLVQSIHLKKKIRLIGVGVSGLKDKNCPVQLSLLTQDNTHTQQWESVDRAVDGIAERFGAHAVKKASLNQFKKGDKK